MTYIIHEKVETIGWADAQTSAPAELVKVAKEMADKGEIASFGKIAGSFGEYTWCVLTVNASGSLTIAKRHSSTSTDS